MDDSSWADNTLLRLYQNEVSHLVRRINYERENQKRVRARLIEEQRWLLEEKKNIVKHIESTLRLRELNARRQEEEMRALWGEKMSLVPKSVDFNAAKPNAVPAVVGSMTVEREGRRRWWRVICCGAQLATTIALPLIAAGIYFTGPQGMKCAPSH